MFDRNLMRLPGMGGVLAALVVLALLQAGAIIAQAFTLSSALSQLWAGASVADVIALIAAFLASFALLQLLRFAQETMLDSYSRKQAESLRKSLLARTFDSSSLLAHRAGTARVADIATQGIDEVQTYLRIIPPKVIGMAAITIPLLACLFVIDWPSGVICLVMFPVIIFFMILLGKQARERSERQYASYTRLTNRFMDTLRGMRTIIAFKASDREAEAAYQHSEDLRVATVDTLKTATLSSVVLDLCATFGVAAVAMMLAFRLLDSTLALSTGLFALILAPEYFSPIRAFASDYHASLDGKNSLSALLELIDSAEPGNSGDKPSGDERTAIEEPAVSLEDVSFIYEGTSSGVEHISLTAQGPQKIGIVGKSGSGKSTLANLIAGFVEPSEGTLTAPPVRYIPQNPYVFRATLEDNIRFYRPDATRAEVQTAVAAVGLETLVADLPDGLDTLVGEGARGLSGGESHRVALARILIDPEARVLVFDEPTAHLDIETELELKGPMLSLMQGRLVFLATHRMHWLSDMDRVITLEGGRVVSDEVKS